MKSFTGKAHNDNVNGAGFYCAGKDKKHQAYGGRIGKGNEEYEKKQYYDHADHLGSSSYITNLDAQIVQHVAYVPFGEVFIEERNQSRNTPYLFNGKELDEETGLYYYGARYYNPRESIFLSVAPMFEEAVGRSPYEYVNSSPLNHIDPDGNKALRWPPTDCWQPMRYGDIQIMYPSAGAEKGLEKLWGRYNTTNISLLSRHKYSSNVSQLKTAGGKVFKPDGKLEYDHHYMIWEGEVKFRTITKTNLSLSEVTTAKKNIGILRLSDKNGQLQAYIDYLEQYHVNKKVTGSYNIFDKRGRFNLVTLPEITDVSEISTDAFANSIDFHQYVPYYKKSDDGVGINIEFRERKTSFFGNQSDTEIDNWSPIYSSMPSGNTSVLH
ncbi:RHS repeat domain-containing protein [Apibacter adventoris]|uniref:RHS repeat domain-containing protein n=1 Tax=Apibacter adventoris TaxID=1679466 RepID=UPI001C86AFBF|nr:RHS repeat-associated core domain-containing protein [Apibacter adventoris]